ncbi:hypothetical protein M5G22_05830 [Pseudomonas sp. TNT2022 ID233]|uniref:hypothetical protein n=1 Tax=Pseudomonas aphyarum TaxID=2942629 RepID=UPI00235ED9D3|nr:hypothetical protein [Pseudomonas aphyarum]MDD1137069.1 hypothetical protein [Pseudomonas aphyarum]
MLELEDNSASSADNIFNTLRQNILAGSYQEYMKDLIETLSDDIRDSLDPRISNNRLMHIKNKEYFFEISLPGRYFPLDRGGDIHLLDSMIGDMFSLQTNTSIKNIYINQVEWEDLNLSLKIKKQTPEKTRDAFQLDQYQPILGFSVKPRLGLSDTDYFDRCKEVARAGFNIIEPDTRKILLSEYDLDKHIEFASEICKIQQKHICAYSVNLSNYHGNIHQAVEKLSRSVSRGPIVIKIDTGLNSIWRIKAVKEAKHDAIITSYPLIKKSISNRVPSKLFDELLSYNGIDIMYPGGFVALPGNGRHYNATEDITHLSESIYKYSSHIKSSKFTPTLTGGLSAGLIHLYYELYGPQVGLFIGGAVSTNKNGLEAGATLCSDIINFAVKQRKNASSYKEIAIPDSNLIKRIKAETDSEYIIPKEFIKHNKLENLTDSNWKIWTSHKF